MDYSRLKNMFAGTLDMNKLGISPDQDIDMLNYIKFVLPTFQFKEFHLSVIKVLNIQANLDTILSKLQSELKTTKNKDVVLHKITEYEKYRNIMIFAPPQHGKSEISSRIYPTYLLGKNPASKVIIASYNTQLARGFMRDAKKLLTNGYYNILFPESKINSRNVTTDYKRGSLNNADIVEIIGKRGSLLSVGVGKGLVGNPVDYAILDDLIKDSSEAYSSLRMEKLWEWYNTVLLTRINNDSKVLMLFTRWSTIDIGAKILDFEPHKWKVLSFPAIMDTPKNEYDSREIGEALWAEKHSLERLLEIKARSLKTFTSLYQQKPIIQGGNLFKKEWFGIISKNEFTNLFIKNQAVAKIKIDGAYTSDKTNDPTGLMTTAFINNHLYIMNYTEVWLEMPDLIKFVKEYFKRNTHPLTAQQSTILIEPKANGLSVIQTLKRETLLNVASFKFSKKSGLSFDLSKGDRAIVTANLPFVESGRVILVEGVWNNLYLERMTQFVPNMPKNDEAVDLTVMSISECYNQIQEVAYF